MSDAMKKTISGLLIFSMLFFLFAPFPAALAVDEAGQAGEENSEGSTSSVLASSAGVYADPSLSGEPFRVLKKIDEIEIVADAGMFFPKQLYHLPAKCDTMGKTSGRGIVMGLFDLFSRGGSKDQAPKEVKKEERLAAYHGLRMEVMSGEENELLFTARLALVPEEGLAELYMLSDLVHPLGQEPVHVKLRGFETSQGLAVHMEGMISQETDVTWRVEDLELLGKDNDRAFFRQATELRGEITRTESDDKDTYQCVVRNISAGGVCFQSTDQFDVGETVSLSAQLLPGQEMEPLLCQVRRVTPRRGGSYYGCQFLQLNSVKENQISKAIMQLQMKRLRR